MFLKSLIIRAPVLALMVVMTTAAIAQPPHLVKDIFPGSTGSSPSYSCVVGDALYFSAADATHGMELWKSDGTDAGTLLVKDINPGSAGSAPYALTSLGSMLYFWANDGSHGYELWKSDGTDAGTVMVKDISLAGGSGISAWIKEMGGMIYFPAFDTVHGAELWMSDGTEAGTVVVKDVRPGFSGSMLDQPLIGPVAIMGGSLYFRMSAFSGGGYELWKSDGTQAGTVMVKGSFSSGYGPSWFTTVGNTVFFQGNSGGSGLELWKSDGTEVGTILVKDINTGGVNSSYPTELMGLGSLLFFFANDGSHGVALWRSDGTSAGTALVSTRTSYFTGGKLSTSGGSIFVAGYHNTPNHHELWKSNGTDAGTVLLNDSFEGSTTGLTSGIEVGSALYFFGTNRDHGLELWKSDGTPLGTAIVADLTGSAQLAASTLLGKVASKLLFGASTTATGNELFVFDPAPSDPPAVSVQAANAITNTTARLNGSVNALGSVTTAQFEWGLTTNYGNTVTVDLLPDDAVSPEAVFAHVAGLAPLSTYHFRVTATNAHGTVSSADSTFTTSNIPDTTKPTVTITSPAVNGNLVEGNLVSVTGTASDNKGVRKVQYALNGGGFTDAVTTLNASGTSATYTALLAPVRGPNTVAVKSIDTRSNESTVVTRAFNYNVIRPLSVVISPLAKGTVPVAVSYMVGFPYTLTAKPSAGYVFNGWTVNDATGTGITPAMQELPTFIFIHQEGLVLTANFTVNPFTAGIIGRFDGLAEPSNAVPAIGTVGSNETVGGFTTTVMGDGSFTGTLKIDGLALPVKGIFDNTGMARFGTARATTAMLVRPGKPGLEVKLNLDMTGTTHLITGTAVQRGRSGIVAQSDIHANRAAYSTASKAPVALAGTVSRAWTMVFRHRATLPSLTSADYPQGDGYATGTVKADGSVSFSGRLADHSSITASAALSDANVWPLYASLYGGRGSFACEVILTATSATDGELSGSTVTWYRPYQNVQWYPWGWAEGIDVEVFGASYQSPTQVLWSGLKATNPVYGNVAVTFKAGLLNASVNKTANFFAASAARVPMTDSTWSFALTPSTGAMSGTFTHSNNTKPAWQGVLIQRGANLGGYGYFMTLSPKVIDGTGESGWVEMTAK